MSNGWEDLEKQYQERIEREKNMSESYQEKNVNETIMYLLDKILVELREIKQNNIDMHKENMGQSSQMFYDNMERVKRIDHSHQEQIVKVREYKIFELQQSIDSAKREIQFLLGAQDSTQFNKMEVTLEMLNRLMQQYKEKENESK